MRRPSIFHGTEMEHCYTHVPEVTNFFSLIISDCISDCINSCIHSSLLTNSLELAYILA